MRRPTVAETLVAVAVLVTLSATILIAVPRLAFWGHVTDCKSQLAQLHWLLQIYYVDHRRWPASFGPQFVVDIWSASPEAAPDLLYCPSVPRGKSRRPTAAEVHFTGPAELPDIIDIDWGRSADCAVMCDRIWPDRPPPHAGKGVCWVSEAGSVHWTAAPVGAPVIGPGAPDRRLRWVEN